ncbi:MAG: acyl-CoA dehydratase activase [Candidatus Bathyarchaeia archaeon]
MIVAGLDMGVQNVKVVLLRGGEVISRSLVPSGFNLREAAEQALKEAAENAKISIKEIDHVTATGMGVDLAPRADSTISMISADALAAVHLHPATRTVIDIGAEESRVISCDEKGVVLDFTINERCAAGAGAFLEAMARALEVDLKDMGYLSLEAQGTVSISATCVIFGESDVVSLIHKQTPKQEIARAIYDALAERIMSMIHRIGLKPDVMLVGGVAKDIGFATTLRRKIGLDVIIPEYPEFAGAFGAALYAVNKARREKHNGQ